MRIKIKRIPKAKDGGVQMFGTPYAGILSVNPFGEISSDTDDLKKNVNDSIKPIDREDANIEAEKGEVLFKFDAGGIFKIKGKKHTQGGTPLKVDTNDFIFSDNKNLAISKQDAEDFEIKLAKKKKDNTPAKVLEREIDLKLYNKFVNILKDPKSDQYAIATAELMLKKYQEKIGQIAFIQETNKDLPNGLPEFSEGTAPVYSAEIENAKDKAPQFALGGMAFGGMNPIDDKCPCGKDAQGNCIPCTDDQTKQLASKAKRGTLKDVSGMTKVGSIAEGDVYHSGTDASTTVVPTKGPKMSNADWTKFLANESPEHKKKRLSRLGVPATDNLILVPGQQPTPSLNRINITPGEIGEVTPPLVPNNIPNIPNRPFEGFDIGMNSNEALSVAAPYLLAMATPTYYDMLQQKHTPDIRLDRLNNTDDISNINQGRSLAQREMFANMDDKTAALAAGASQVNADRAIMSSNANLRNANTQIANQESMINFQKDASDNDYNLAHIQETYRNNILSDQRTNEMRTNGAISSLNNMNAVQRNLDIINQGLTKSVLPYLTNAYYDKDGNFLGQGDIDDAWKDKIAYSQQMSPMTVNKNRMPISTGFGSLNSVKASGDTTYASAIASITKDLNNPDPQIRALAAANYIKLYKPNNKEQSPYDEITASMYRALGITQ